MNKLEAFILFHLFKIPAALTALTVVCVLAGSVLFQRAVQMDRVVQARQKIDTNLISNTAHLLTNTTVVDVVTKAQIPTCRILATNPAVQIAVDTAGMIKLEKFGLTLKEADYSQGKLIVSLQKHPVTYRQ